MIDILVIVIRIKYIRNTETIEVVRQMDIYLLRRQTSLRVSDTEAMDAHYLLAFPFDMGSEDP